MKIAMITFYTMLRHLRDKRVMIAFTLMPLVMIAILGAALDFQFTPQKLKEVKIGYYSSEHTMLTSIVNQFLGSEEVASMLEIKNLDSYDEGIQAIKKGEIEALIYIPTHIEGSIQSTIEIHSNKDNSVVFPIMESFIQSYNLNEVLLHLEGQPMDRAKIQSNIEETKIVTDGRIPRGIDYYSIATLFQVLIMGAIFGVFAVTKDLGNFTYSRLSAAPIRPLQITIGKLLGSTLSLFLIAVFTFLVSKYLYKGNWDADLWLILTVLLLISLVAVSIGMLLAFVTRNTMISALTTFILSFFFTFVAGGFSPMDGKVFDFLSQFSPNKYAQHLIFTNIYDGLFDSLALYKLLMITGVVVLLTMFAGRRKMA